MKIIISFFRKNNIFFSIKIILVFIISLSYYILSIFVEEKLKKQFVSFDSINDSMIGVFKDLYDIFISFKRELELYENSLTNCEKSEKEIYRMIIPSISNIKNQNLENEILQLTKGLGYNDKVLSNFTELFNGNACNILINTESRNLFCSIFWDGILTKGIELTIVKLSGITGTVIEELTSLNNGELLFKDFLTSSVYNSFDFFFILFYQRIYRTIDDVFIDLRSAKLNLILKIKNKILIIYIVLSVFLFIIFFYFINSIKNSFNSFFYFIGIFPRKVLLEDENISREIIKLGKYYY